MYRQNLAMAKQNAASTIEALVDFCRCSALVSVGSIIQCLEHIHAGTSNVHCTQRAHLIILLQCFLSEEMMYSAAFRGDEEHGPRGDLTVGVSPGDLEHAQKRKIQSYLRQARLRPGDRLLEIGSGWGALAIAVCHPICFILERHRSYRGGRTLTGR